MPANNTISDEITGTVALPLTRVKKIIASDDDLPTTSCSNTAAFAITIATQQFLAHLVTQTHNVVKSERKPRKNVQYRDVANAVARHDNLEFLTDVVPRTTTYKAHVAKKKQDRDERSGGRRSILDQVSLPISKLPNVGRMLDGAVDETDMVHEARNGRMDGVERSNVIPGQGEDEGVDDARVVDRMDLDEDEVPLPDQNTT